MKEIILVKYGEIILKGLNRPIFEAKLVSNIKIALRGMGKYNILKAQAAIYIEPLDDGSSLNDMIVALQKVFGIVSISRVAVLEKDIDQINIGAAQYLRDVLVNSKTFKVETKRADKRFPMQSPQISCEVGGYLLSEFSNLSVDVINPEVVVRVEIRDWNAYVSCEKIAGAGGMPIGTNGKAAILLSGGIDSPVAAWMIAKRGVQIEAIHFHSHPYTSERAKQKVVDLSAIVAKYAGSINLHVVPFTQIQLLIHEKCPQEQMTLIMRRFMMKIAQKIASMNGCHALITGESIGQVASQTMQSLGVTDAAVDMPVFRPLIGMDKDEIIAIARKIETFETSILPYEDCCTVFVPKHPKTKPQLDKILLSEQHLDVEALIDEAVKGVEVIRTGN